MNINKLRYLIIFLSLILLLSCVSDTYTYFRKGGNHLHLNDGTHELFWFCGIHSNDPENIMFAGIEEEFLKFKPNLVLVEGGRDKDIKQNKNEAILHGESSYVAFLAQTHNIECLSTEPPDSYMGEQLLLNYKMNDIIAMITLRQIQQWQRESNNRSIDFTKMIVGFIAANSKKMFKNIDFEINIIFIQDLIEPYIGFRINNENWLSVPARKILKKDININTIHKDTSNIRNNFLVEMIQEKRKTYTKIFIMMGFDHEIKIMEKLKIIYKK